MSNIYKEEDSIKVATAFSGGFGSVEFALKYENIPHEVVFACEWLEPQRKAYLLNHGEPTSNFYKDIKEFNGKKYRGKIDLYHLSPPCQSYSMAGKRAGASDERGGLMFEAIRSISEVQPKMFTIENVKGLLSSNGGEDFRHIMSDLQTLKNYTLSHGVLNAREQGTPQNRERLFIIGVRANGPQMAFPSKINLLKTLKEVLEDDVPKKYYLSDTMLNSFIRKSEETSYKFNPKNKEDEYCQCITARYYKMSVSDPYIQERPHKIGFINQDTQASAVFSDKGLSPTLCAGTHGYDQGYVSQLLPNKIGFINQDTQASAVFSDKGLSPTLCAGTHGYDQGYVSQLLPIGSVNNAQSGRVYSPNGVAPALSALGGGLGAKTGLFDMTDRVKWFVDPHGTNKGGWSLKLVSPAITTSSWSHNNFIKPDKIRRLTPRECSRIQGDFDDLFVFGTASDTKLYEFIGNAIDINTYRRLLRELLKHTKNAHWNKSRVSTFKHREIQATDLFGELL